MHRIRAAYNKLLLGFFILGMLDVLLLPSRGAGAATLAQSCGQWSIVTSPSPGSMDELYGAAAISPQNVWAVGRYLNAQGVGQTLIEHWNGKQWSIVKSPNPGAYGNGLNSVVAISSTDVWAVGDSYTTEFGYQTLIEQWNGIQWRVVKSPSLGSYPYDFRAISAVDANDIWAVGSYTAAPGDISLTLTEHWNGTAWSVISSPSPTGDDYLLVGVAAVSTSDVWAVGDYSPAGQNLVVQWNGTSWNVVPSPYRKGTVSGLSAISADSPADVWAVGSDINNQNFVYQTLIEHYCSSS